jgi:hypothetical protein
MGMGLYFVFLRPPLLPEDLLYIGTTVEHVKRDTPGLLNWLPKVFWVLGGYIFTTGGLIFFIAFTTFRTRMPGVSLTVFLAGMSSIGSMTVVNFLIDSDFKWLLLLFTLPWAIALIFYRFHR